MRKDFHDQCIGNVVVISFQAIDCVLDLYNGYLHGAVCLKLTNHGSIGLISSFDTPSVWTYE